LASLYYYRSNRLYTYYIEEERMLNNRHQHVSWNTKLIYSKYYSICKYHLYRV